MIHNYKFARIIFLIPIGLISVAFFLTSVPDQDLSAKQNMRCLKFTWIILPLALPRMLVTADSTFLSGHTKTLSKNAGEVVSTSPNPVDREKATAPSEMTSKIINATPTTSSTRMLPSEMSTTIAYTAIATRSPQLPVFYWTGSPCAGRGQQDINCLNGTPMPSPIHVDDSDIDHHGLYGGVPPGHVLEESSAAISAVIIKLIGVWAMLTTAFLVFA
ncbi:MAG: hypothetical protein M1820_002989 [Bogoriella megaspora]|nr:MAG: hypothetical protein M1820_002989 [Bogoriella megaspora]